MPADLIRALTRFAPVPANRGSHDDTFAPRPMGPTTVGPASADGTVVGEEVDRVVAHPEAAKTNRVRTPAAQRFEQRADRREVMSLVLW
jgi:hypothetical protein